MTKTEAAPLMLGFILGPMPEENFRHARKKPAVTALPMDAIPRGE